MEKLSTGIEILDTRLDGGFPEGSVVSLIADPMSTAELFLYDLASTRHTHYFTTARSADTVEVNLEQMNRETSDLTIVDVYSEDDDEKAEKVIDHLDEVGEGDNIILDTFTDFTNNFGGYNEILDELYRTSHEKGCLTYLYMIKDDDATLSYDESRVPYFTDVVLKMLFNISGEQVENRLAISKLRGQEPPTRTIKLNIGTSIEIDTSRDIA
ncbi:MAG: hypothetical protein SXQ77_04940 [Halobacteria archaeon]|nr:hypothetical protein [Halobacteria archaeon]